MCSASVYFAEMLNQGLCRFFEDYKKNEHKEVKVDEFLGAELARKTITESMVSTEAFHTAHNMIGLTGASFTLISAQSEACSFACSASA